MKQESSLQRLCSQNIGNINSGVAVPVYDRDAVKTGIVHIGPSAFFRGHLAVYIDDLLAQGETEWGICAVSLKSSGVRDALKDQDYLYSVVEQSTQSNSTRVIGSIKDILVAAENPQAVLDKMASPDIKLVSLTVTQGGYYYKNGNLDFDDQDIKADLLRADEPTSTVGYIVKALEMRMDRGLPPFRVMSCDNLPGNGTILRNVVLAYASQRSPQLRDWIANNVDFPSTMVDRIVPKTTAAHIDNHNQQYNLADNWPIYTEKFRQFVIEKPKNGPAFPQLDRVGALLTDDVASYELMKIRLLNGTHMALGITGRLAGYTYAHEAVADPKIRTYISGLMNDMEGTLPDMPGVSIPDYKTSIFERLDSPFMKDELARLARNGTDKVDSRFLQPLRDATSCKKECNNITFAVASWVEYLKHASTAFDILDEKAVRNGLPSDARQGGAKTGFLATHPEIFGTDIASSKKISARFERHMQAICQNQQNIVEALPAQQAAVSAPQAKMGPALKPDQP